VSDLWKRLQDLTAYRVTEIPRREPAVTDDSRESLTAHDARGQRVAALTAAYHEGITPGSPGVIAFGWVRPHTAGPVHVVAVGAALEGSEPTTRTSDPPARTSEMMLALPAGSRAERVTDLTALLGTLPAWRTIAGISDGLLAENEHHPTLATSLDEVLLGTWNRPFGWIVIAEVLPVPALRALADETAARLQLTEGTADRFPGRALDARRLKLRHAELARGLSTGMWRVHMLAGGTDEKAASRVAGLLCASTDLTGLPYAIAPAPAPAGEVAEAHALSREVGEPFYAATEFLAAVACPPRAEVPGIRLALRPDFDTTPDGFEPQAGVPLGEILDRNLMPAGTFRIAAESLNRHVFVTGATGAGKSQTIRGLLDHVTVPWLVIEPAKAEYRRMANRTNADVIRIRPGEPDAIPAGINPLEPAAGFPLQTHADMVKALFVASFRSEEPFPQVLSAALTLAYTEAGWDLTLGEPATPGARYPTLADVQRAAATVVAEIGYSQRITDDVLGFMKVRLASLRHGTTGRFLAGGHPIDVGKLLASNVVLEIEDVGDDRDKAFLMGAVLIRLAEHLRVAGPVADEHAGLRHLTVVEEAHRLLRKPRDDGAAAHAVEMFAGLLSELRAYGEGLIIADQIPARLVPDVIKNTAVKITHRLPAADDRDALGATMNLTAAQSRYLVTLAPGEAAVFTDGMDHAMLVKMPNYSKREWVTPPASAISPVGVTGRRSSTCGPECVARPCTLRDMRAAQRAGDERPVIRLWTELSVLAHLAGWPMPVPRPGVLDEVRALQPRLRDCLLSHAVDEAVACRVAAISGTDALRPDIGGLTAHVWAAIGCRVSRDMWLCSPDEDGWRLATAPPGAAFGVDNPSAVERAVGAPRGDAEFAERLSAALADFTDCRWPVNYLTHTPSSEKF
jgi:hypothetical protein